MRKSTKQKGLNKQPHTNHRKGGVKTAPTVNKIIAQNIKINQTKNERQPERLEGVKYDNFS